VVLGAGQVEAALELARAAIVYAAAMGSIYGEGLARRACAQALSVLGDRQHEVDEQFAASVDLFSRGGASLEMARTYALWGDSNAGHGVPRLSRALELYEGVGLGTAAERVRAMIDTRTVSPTSRVVQ